MSLKHKDVWSAKHKGLVYEIVHWGISEYQPRGIWNIYIYLQIMNKEIEKIFWLKSEKVDWGITYDYFDLPIDMANGITYYGKVSGFDGNIKQVKLGNDYNHSWNDCHSYDEIELKRDAEHCIDDLLERFGDLLTNKGKE